LLANTERRCKPITKNIGKGKRYLLICFNKDTSDAKINGKPENDPRYNTENRIGTFS
jgi:hypothetical protein